ncbi:MAG: hypothetical protein K5870_02505 [Lachnospiraceae bacterium]|nr:hypothetical protein [Lachnospiraceae bacterium]
MRSKRIIANLTLISMLLGCLAGCSKGSSSAQEIMPTIELIEPVGTAQGYEKASFRNLSMVSTYSGIICPDTAEYTYESALAFSSYAALPGEQVNSGDPLFYSRSESIEDDVEKIEDENAELVESFADYLEDYVYDLSSAKKAEYKASVAYQEIKNYEPSSEDDPMYGFWARSVMPSESAYKQSVMSREKLEQSYIEKQQLFELDYNYNLKRIERLKEKENEGSVTSGMNGVVVASAFYNAGDTIAQGSSIIAVGDPDDKEIKCEFISKSIVNKAVDVYAIIDGQRYEVVYENMEPEEYRRLMQKNDAVYTTFKLAETAEDLPLGKMATIVVVEKRVTNALCVPKGAVNKDDAGFFVYVLDGEESIYTPVQTGMSDGCYTEVTYGVKEGDKILYDAPYDLGTKFGKVQKGNIVNTFQSDGYLFYPSAEWISNPAKTGTCYLKKMCVSRYEQVSAGQLLCQVEITGDSVETGRIERKIQRQQERLVDLYDQKTKTSDEDELNSLDRAIRERERSIEHLQKQLDKLTRYLGVVDITAPYDGIVTDLSELKDGELIGYDTKLLQVSSNISSYIVVEDKGFLSYGNEATVTIKDQNGERTDISGTVVTLNPYGLSKELNTGYALVKINSEDMDKLIESGSNMQNGYWSRSRYTVSATAKDMNNVLLIPKTAAYKSGNDTYVITKGDDGEVRLVKFYAGGADNANYWVAYGDITEGMEICLE